MTAFGIAHSGPVSFAPVDCDRFVPAPALLPVQQNPLGSVVRAKRGRWTHVGIGAIVLGPMLSTLGYFSGTQLYQSQAIVRVYPQEANVLYRTGDDSVLKTFDS